MTFNKVVKIDCTYDMIEMYFSFDLNVRSFNKHSNNSFIEYYILHFL